MKIKNKILDPIAYLVILGGSILTYVDIHYVKGLDSLTSLLLFFFNFGFWHIVYNIIYLLWDKFLRSSIIIICNYFLSRNFNPHYSSVLFCNTITTDSRQELEQSNNTLAKTTVRYMAKENAEKSDNEGKDELSDSIQEQYDYAIHYLGRYLNENEKGIFKDNLLKLAKDDLTDSNMSSSSSCLEHSHDSGCEPGLIFKPVSQTKIGSYNFKDMAHLCHAIANHTIRKRSTHEIAIFYKYVFPGFCKGYEISTIERRLTDTDYNNILIPVEDKRLPLPVFD